MRIKILTSLPHADLQAISFLGLLKEKWDNNDITIVTDGYYDFLHVIGFLRSYATYNKRNRSLFL